MNESKKRQGQWAKTGLDSGGLRGGDTTRRHNMRGGGYKCPKFILS